MACRPKCENSCCSSGFCRNRPVGLISGTSLEQRRGESVTRRLGGAAAARGSASCKALGVRRRKRFVNAPLPGSASAVHDRTVVRTKHRRISDLRVFDQRSLKMWWCARRPVTRVRQPTARRPSFRLGYLCHRGTLFVADQSTSKRVAFRTTPPTRLDSSTLTGTTRPSPAAASHTSILPPGRRKPPSSSPRRWPEIGR
jgi:hypothetical protein